MMTSIRPLFAALALGFAANAGAQNAHEHGVADLRVAVDGSTVLVEFDSPLANLVGFEHAARSDAERKAMADLKARLQKPDGLLVLAAAAQCALQDVELELPDADDHDHHGDDHKHAHAEKKAGHGHAHGHKHEEHAHKHDYDDKHAHHAHDEDDHHDHEHADAYVAWAFECGNAAALDAVEVSVIEAFPGIRVLRTETAGPRGQNAVRIEAPKARLSL